MDLEHFTVDELREINDALNDAVLRMLEKQTAQEREYASLPVAWEAQKKVVGKLLPGPAPAWLIARDPKVRERSPL